MVALLVAGAWALIHLFRRRELHSRIDLSVGIEFLGKPPSGDELVVQVIADLKNSGTVRHKISDLRYSLRVLREGDRLVNGTRKILEQLVFPNKIVNRRRFFPLNWEYTFVEPGVTNTYRSVTTIPGDAIFVLATTWFEYYDRRDSFHKSERAFPVPRDLVSAVERR